MARPAANQMVAMNQAPHVIVPASYTISDFFPLDITGIVFSDVDGGGADEVATFTVDIGVLSALSRDGVVVTGSGTNALTLTGSIDALNAFIAAGNVDYFGFRDDVLHVTIDDQGHGGLGGALTDSADVPMEFEPFPLPPPAPTHGDFNGDRFGDLLVYRNDGCSAIWSMQENARLGSGTNLPGNGPTWHAKALVDFDAVDGLSDILWQNDNGAVAIWQMDGATIVAQADLPNPGAATHVVDAKDFDGNGGADILLQNDNGQLSLWLMQDATHILAGGEVTIDQNPGAPWHAAVVGDFNGDGRAGILFTTANGATALWEDFVATGRGQGRFELQADLQNNGPTWHAKAAGDFDGDGKDDILWQNDNGAASIWLMDGAHIKNGFDIAGTEANGPTWHVVDARDMNADGRDDILWQNDNGAVALWEDFTPDGAGVARFATQLDVIPAVNPSGHLDWQVL